MADGSETGGRGNRAIETLKENAWVPSAIALGLVVGAFIPPDSDYQGTKAQARVSSLLGWTYFFAWSISFYPQVVLNYQRRSVNGLSLDFQLLNAVGFACYFIFNVLMYYSPLIKKEYADHHEGESSSVQLNDVVFAGHAFILTLVTLTQIAVYFDYPPLNKWQRVVRLTVVSVLTGFIIVASIIAVAIAATSERLMEWLTYLQILAQAKVVISVVKYCPQVWMNYQRKSTVGWNIHNVLLDFSGGLLSVAQLIWDAAVSQEWSKVTGNPVKLLLGNLSMFFDVIFMVQHYGLYKGARQETHREPPLIAVTSGSEVRPAAQ